MCGGVIGDVFKSVDTVANKINPFHHFTQWATDNTVGKIPGVGKPMAQLGDWGNNHPAEVAALAGAGYGAWELGAEYLGGAGGVGAGGAGDVAAGGGAAAADGGSVNLFADAVPGAGGDVGATAGGMSGAGAETAGIGTMSGSGSGGSNAGWLSSIFGGGGGGGGATGFGMNAATAKNGLGAMQVLSSLYGMEQQNKLSKRASAQSMSNAGLQAVQRSMAAQGYQGSGNMMQALSKYGADAYGANLGQQQASLSNTMSGLGLLTAGVGNLAGWGATTPTKP